MPKHVLQLTDLHLFADRSKRLYGVPTWDSFLDVWNFLRPQLDRFDWIVLTGDLAHDEQRDTYEALRRLLDEHLDRCRLIPGNHDDRHSLRSVFREVVPAAEERITFAESAGAWRLIGLDTHVPGEVSGRVDEGQLQWLEGELASHADHPTLLFIHHPPVSVGSPWLDRLGLDESERLCQLILSAPQVCVISAGHVHQEFAGRLGAASVVTTPSTCLQFLPHSEEPQYDTSPPGFRVFELSEDDYHTEVIRLPEVNYPPDR